MLKKFVFFFCLLKIPFTAHAQFFALENDSMSPYVTVLPYPMDSYYRVVSYDHSFPAQPVRRTSIKVYNANQQFVKTIQLLKGITLVNDYPPLLHNKRLLWPANYNDTIEFTKNALVVLELDTNYNFRALHVIARHANRAAPTGIVGYSTGFVVGEYFSSGTGTSTVHSTKVYKLNLNLVKTDSAFLQDELRLKTHQSQNNQILGASDSLSAGCTPTTQASQKIVLDTTLSVINCWNIPVYGIYFCYDAAGNMIQRYAVGLKQKSILFPLSNSRVYMHGRVENSNCPQPGTSKAISSGVLNGNLHSNYYLDAHKPANTEFPLYFASDCDYDGSNTISVGIIGLKNNYAVDKNFYRPYYARPRTKVTVTRLDTTGALIWHTEFGGEMNYFARSVAFTSDGGCVIAGSRYDSAAVSPNKVFQNFLLKLDAEGNQVTVGLNENDFSKTRIKCFPNPASQTIQLSVPRGIPFIVQLFNTLGELVLIQKDYLSLSAIDISELEKGIYVYKIISSQKVYSGKFIKAGA